MDSYQSRCNFKPHIKSSLHCPTSNSLLYPLDFSIICQVQNSQSNSPLNCQLPPCYLFCYSDNKSSVPKLISLQAGVSKLNSILSLAVWDHCGGPTENTASSIVVCWFTAAEMSLQHSCVATSAARSHRERHLQHLFYCCVTSQRTWRVPLLRVYWPLPNNGCFSASTVLALSKYTTLLFFLEELMGRTYVQFFFYVKFIGHNFEVSHLHHACNCWTPKSIYTNVQEFLGSTFVSHFTCQAQTVH
jgi:hypothetical protein